MSGEGRYKGDLLEKQSYEPGLKGSDINGWVKRGHQKISSKKMYGSRKKEGCPKFN